MLNKGTNEGNILAETEDGGVKEQEQHLAVSDNRQVFTFMSWLHASYPSLKISVLRDIHHICFEFQQPLSFRSREGRRRMRNRHLHPTIFSTRISV